MLQLLREHYLDKAAWIFLFAAFFLFGLSPIIDGDIFMYLALARDFFRNGYFPSEDPFIPSAPGMVWRVTYEWGGFFIYYLSYILGGFVGVALMKVALATVIWLPAVTEAWRRFRGSAIHFLLFTLGLIAFTWRYSERTALVADVLLMLTLVVTICDWKGWPRIRWLYPILALVWINCHGSFPMVWIFATMWIGGWLLFGDYKAAENRLWVLGWTAVLPILNPEGWSGITYPFEFLEYRSQFLLPLNNEWQPTFSGDHLRYYEVKAYLALFFISGLYFLWSARRGLTRQMIPYLALGVFMMLLGASANRFVGIASASLCLLSVVMPGAWRPQWNIPSWLKLAGSLALVASLVTGVYWRIGLPHRLGFGPDERIFPVKTVEFLKYLPPRGPIWNSHYFGCYLAWELDGRKKMMIHGFVIDLPVFQRYFSGPGRSREAFDALVQQYGIHEILLQKHPFSESMIGVLVDHPDWKLFTQDETSVLFEKRYD